MSLEALDVYLFLFRSCDEGDDGHVWAVLFFGV